MVGKADIGTNEIDILRKTEKAIKEGNNMRRERRQGQSKSVAPPRGGLSLAGNGGGLQKTPLLVNLTSVDEFGDDTTIINRLNFTGTENIIVDEPTTLPGDGMFLKHIQPFSTIPFGCEIKLKPRNARTLTIQEGGNIVIPNNNDIFTLDDDFWITLKYYEDAFAIGIAGWVIEVNQFIPELEVNFGIFPLASQIDIDFGAAYVDPPVITLGYQTDVGIFPASDLNLQSRLKNVSGLYTGVIITVDGTIPGDTTGQFISVNAIARTK